MATHYLACDLGAESGRLMLGSLEGGRVSLEELHRFPNTPVKVAGSLCWDIPRLFNELKTGLRKAAARRRPIASISTDSWGVDYVLLDGRGAIIPPAFHYRDARTARGVERVRAAVNWPTIFQETGIQFMPLNTLYQVAAETPTRLAQAHRLLMIADAFNFFLCGEAAIEESNASTTQFYNPRTRQWSRRMLDAAGLPARLLPRIVSSGTRLGRLRKELADETGLPPIEVFASCSHDTGAAVAAVPACGKDWAYLSSGTWSLIGVERAAPLMTDACRELNFTNEIGFGGSVRLLKNISGLWLVQECRRAWAADGHSLDYDTLANLAAEAPPFVSLINPADARFLAPPHMPEAIAAFCRDTGQPVPATPGAFIRCALESLALLYRRTLGQIEQLTERKIERLHIVGGGSRNQLLNQFTADALQIPVLAGPVEATAAGNVLVQAIVLGQLDSLAAARQIVRDSFPVATVEPGDATAWNEAFERFAGCVVRAR
jgi:rhamnulokinase